MDVPAAWSVYRSLTHAGRWSRVGLGVMDKAGLACDHRDFRAPTWSLIWLLRGKGRYLQGSLRANLRPGSCFLRRCGQAHSTEPDPDSGWLEIFLDLSPHLAQALEHDGVLRSTPLVWFAGMDATRLDHLLALRSALRRASEAELPSLCLQVASAACALQNLAQQERAQQDPLEQACQVLSSDQRPIPLIARELGMDYEVFRKTFRARYDCSPHQYRLQRRLDQACALLQSSELSITAIAEQLGYSSAHAFSEQFHARIGVPPSSYRSR